MGEAFAPLTIFLLGLFTFTTAQILIASDMGWHMNAALNIFTGKGYVDMGWSPQFKKGPLWPFMISLTYHLFGVSPWSGFWAVRIFAVLNPVIIYYFGKKLYDHRIGLAASLLTLSSYSVNYWSYRHLDAVWPFFTIISILYLYIAMEKSNYIYFSVSGILLALAYLIKQVPILLTPLPFILIFFINDYRSNKNIKGVLLWILLFSSMTLPWIYYVYSNTYNISLSLIGPGGKAVARGFVSGDSLQFLKKYFIGLWAYYSGGDNAIANNFTLAPLFICSWIYTIYLCLRGEKASLVAVLVLLLLSPVMAHVGIRNQRVGQLIILFVFSYLVTAKLCWDLTRSGLKLIKRVVQFDLGRERYVYWSVVAGLIIIQTFVYNKGDRGNIHFITQNYFYQSLIWGKGDKKIVGNFGELSKQCGDWIKRTLPDGSRLLVSKPIEGKPVYFYTDGNYPVFVMPVIQSNRMPREIASKKNEDIIFLSAWTARLDPRNKLFLLTETDLLKCIKENQIDYVVVHKMRNYLSEYFERNASFTKMIEFGNGAIKVYKIDDARPIGEFRMMISKKLITYLKSLRNNDSEKFVWYVNKFFEPLLDWNSEKVQELLQLNNDGIFQNAVTVRENKIYHSL